TRQVHRTAHDSARRQVDDQPARHQQAVRARDRVLARERRTAGLRPEPRGALDGASGHWSKLLAIATESRPPRSPSALRATAGRTSAHGASEATWSHQSKSSIAQAWLFARLMRRTGVGNVVTITPDGQARLERLDDMLDGVQDQLLEPLSRRERRQLA